MSMLMVTPDGMMSDSRTMVLPNVFVPFFPSPITLLPEEMLEKFPLPAFGTMIAKVWPIGTLEMLIPTT